MARITGHYRTIAVAGERVRAFIPGPLPPRNPPLRLDDRLAERHRGALAALGRLNVAGAMVPDAGWFLYGFVRKEAVISSQIEGTQASLRDVLKFEATEDTSAPADVEHVCNYVAAITWARRDISRRKGLPLSTRLLAAAHKRLMRGASGLQSQPGELRRSQNWIGGSRPGDARFVPPPPDALPAAMSSLEKWLHHRDPLPPLVRAGLAHVQFETIHPFLDGNGRIGRLLITLLLEHWKLTSQPLLYLSLSLKRRQQEYYDRLQRVRIDGDWEGWTDFFLECVRDAAVDGVTVATALFAQLGNDRRRLLKLPATTIPAIRLFDRLPDHPIVTLSAVIDLLDTTKPTAAKAIGILTRAGILRETTGKRRDRVYAYHAYLQILTGAE